MIARIVTKNDDIASVKHDCIEVAMSDEFGNELTIVAFYYKSLQEVIKKIERKHKKTLSNIVDSGSEVWAIITTPKRSYKLTAITFDRKEPLNNENLISNH
ncbi:hypothetical protein [Lysinibacillus sphaericus]|uniref:hypothetical protein n=1 Tax=Lysinibacillus sphaericus TaxID=1421 RepID=UPI0018CD6CD2|nr:hypothetical protein [Lysinibacillus sphaericus]MBG9479398.1 hypothetical protein [Lysinibacillus sphaericus]MBG9479448.1 hypothetical protein [Lysinibacillus sphaericus]